MRWKRVLLAGIILLSGYLLLGGCLLVITGLQPCGWLDSYLDYTGCIRQLDMGGFGSEVFAPDLTMFAAYSVNGMSVWRLADGQWLTEVPGQFGVFSSSSAFFIVSSTESISVWNTQDWTRQAKLDIDSIAVAEIAIAPDLSRLAIAFRKSSSPTWQLQIWQTSDETLMHKLEGHTDYISTMAYSSDGIMLASGSHDHTVRLWQADGKLLKTLKGHSSNVEKVIFAPDNKTLASSSWDSTIRVWQTDSGRALFTLEGDNTLAFDIAYSPDGSVLASAGTEGVIQLWNVKTGSLIRSLRQSWRGTDINALAFSQDGKIFATAQIDGLVRLYDVQQLLGGGAN